MYSFISDVLVPGVQHHRRFHLDVTQNLLFTTIDGLNLMLLASKSKCQCSRLELIN